MFLEVNEAAMGARPTSDGPNTVEELMRNTRNNPLEDPGMHLPLICDRYEIRDDVPPTAGKFRGGMGVVNSQRFLTPGSMTHESDRHDDTPCGIFGGGEGITATPTLHNADDKGGEPRPQYARFSGLQTRPGDVVTYRSPCGGGFGSPLEREPGRVLNDILDDYITPEHAVEVYGVVVDAVDDGYGWAVNLAATAKRRAELRAARPA